MSEVFLDPTIWVPRMSLRYVNARNHYTLREDDGFTLRMYDKRVLDRDAKVWATLKRKAYRFAKKKRLFMEYETAFNRALTLHMDRLNMIICEASGESSTLSLLLMQ